MHIEVAGDGVVLAQVLTDGIAYDVDAKTQETEVAIGCDILNRMTALGRPESPAVTG